ncbi:ABC transporter substrate-binding protein [Calycomorphotria hydatis]|uniref:Oligopeptide-binding protein AppA n=1 Tax=Calycomorphotria hydatis TaxID=2528027 RepID=A0A517T5W6_9PLAN|nr:ABC transporter substrate-binding protein [Calycomorphotria hydatis]QDT63751.1 Oligopeptide-binding protein AppA precursor [Calycomorphotria hydatis]
MDERHRSVSIRHLVLLLLIFCFPVLVGCPSSSSNNPKPDNGAESSSALVEDVTGEPPAKVIATEINYAVEVPDDLTSIPLMTDVDGLDIPRLEDTKAVEAGGPIPVDEFNPAAKDNPTEPVTGGSISIRFNSEPKTFNPIVETSAVQSYIGSYVQEPLVWQDPETLEYKPFIAHTWQVEDSVKLVSDFPGKERLLLRGADGEPVSELEIEFADDSKEVTLQTVDVDGQPVGGTWVGLRPAEGDIVHQWSDDSGLLKLTELPAGKYKVVAGFEYYGKLEEGDDGKLTLSPVSKEHALAKELEASGEESLSLTEEQVVDVQRGTVFTYLLRDDVTWSDGSPFTTRDLEFAYAVVNNPYVDGESLRVYYSDLVACDAIDDHTIRMKYRQQYFRAFEFTLGLSFYAPPWHFFEKLFKEDGKTLTLDKLTPEEETKLNSVSASGQVFGKFFNTDDRYNLKPLGTGPYVIGDWERSTQVDLKRRKDYWNEDYAGYLDQILVKFIPDDPTAMQALRGHKIDFFWNISPEQYFEELKGPPEWIKKDFVKAQWFYPSYSYLGWNMLKPKFQDRRTRLAMALLFDAQEYVEKKLHDSAILVSGSQYIFGPAYDHSVKPIGYDPETARDLLADAGWIDTDGDNWLDRDGEKFEFELLMPQGKPATIAQAEIMQKRFQDVGIQMHVRTLEWASFISRVMAKDFDAVRLGWAMSLESDPYQIWHSSGAAPEARGSNAVSFSNKTADALIEKIRISIDPEERHKYMFAFHRLLDHEQPYMFLYTPQDLGVYNQKFRGVKFYPIRPGFDLREWYIPKELQ